MEKIAVSACLLGVACRYDGKAMRDETICEYVKDKEVLPICPECAGGLPTPRVPCEIIGEKVLTKEGVDRTKEYRDGASAVLKEMKKKSIGKAILKAKSPSCGVNGIYDGTFTRTLIPGKGVCARLLEANGIEIIDSEEVKQNL